jgi:hypothetical protein
MGERKQLDSIRHSTDEDARTLAQLTCMSTAHDRQRSEDLLRRRTRTGSTAAGETARPQAITGCTRRSEGARPARRPPPAG